MSISILIDCDPGVDDATMLLLALGSPELDVRAITTVGGNVPGALTARNALFICKLAGRDDVPVHVGACGPLRRGPVDASRFHGETGLGPLAIGEAGDAHETHAVDAIIDLIMSHPKQITIVVTGPMTNLALAIQREPRVATSCASIVAMGGARSAGGNITASAEFNIFADPHAAQVVLGSEAEVAMFGLDVTHQVRCTEERVAAIAALPGERPAAVASLMRFSNGVMREVGIDGGSPLHDPCPIAWLIDPDLFALKPCTIEVETESPLTIGHTAVEFRKPGRHRWATEANADGVFALLTERLT